MKPYQYERAEARAANEAAAARAKNDMPAAAAAKRAEVFNNEAARAAFDALDFKDASLRYFVHLQKKTTFVNIEADYNDQIFAILGMFGLAKLPAARTTALGDWLQQQADLGKRPFVPGWLVALNTPMDWKKLTVQQFRELVETVQQIEFMGRHEHKMLVIRGKESFVDVDADIAESIEAHAGENLAGIEDLTTADHDMGVLRQNAAAYFFGMIRARTVALVADGGHGLGKFFNAFTRSADQRGDWEVLMRIEYTKKLMDIWAPIYSKNNMGKRATPIDDGRKLTRRQLIGVALNWGNEGNRQRLMDG